MNRVEYRLLLVSIIVTTRPPATDAIYLGIYAPRAHAVSVIGSFNQWCPGQFVLEHTHSGWWHCAVILSKGTHLYQFWVEDADAPSGKWIPDYENNATAESGYPTHHSVINSHLWQARV